MSALNISLPNEMKEWTGVTVGGLEIVSTPGHKYFLPETKAWVAATELKVGTKVLLSDGSYGIIEVVRDIHYDTPQTTYNFEVEGFHTYFVGNGVLVHNMNGGDCRGNYKPVKDGNYRAVINPGETEAPHAHIFNRSENIGRFFSNGKIDQSLLRNKKAMDFVKKHHNAIMDLIENFYGKR